jgi:hypothetical protein
MVKRSFTFIIVSVAVITMLTTASCKSRQQAVQQPAQPTTSQKTQQMREEAELIKAQQELADAKAVADRAAKQREADATVADANAKAQATRLAEATEQPCQIYDDADWFTATGTRRVKQSSINTAATALLRTTQQQLRLKLKGLYKAVVRDYFDQMDMDEGSYAASHIESAGDYIIDQKCNETYEVCRKNTAADAEGFVTLYMAIKVSKKAIIDEAAQTISNDKKMEVRFNEKQFRDSALKVFEQDQQMQMQEFQNSQNQ